MSQVHLTVLDVGHGSAAVLTGPDATVLIDSGPGSWAMRYLKDQGISHLDGVAITHTDEDHLKGLVALLDSGEFTFDLVRLNSDAAKPSALWEAVSFSLDQHHQAKALDFQISLAAGDVLPEVAPGVVVEVLAPSRYLAARGPGSTDRRGRTLSANSVSAAVRVLVNGEPRVLLAADVDRIGLDSLLLAGDITAPVLVFPHHGGLVKAGAKPEDNASFARELCAAVQPEFVVFSLGRGRHRTPRPEIVQAVRESGADVRVACTQLSEACAPKLPPLGSATHLATLPARGEISGACCGGTIRIHLPGAIVPSRADHEDFKTRFVPLPLCRT